LGDDFQLKLTLLRLGIGGTLRRYWAASRHSMTLLALVWRYAGVIRQFEKDSCSNRRAGVIAVGRKLLGTIKMRALLQAFEASYDAGRGEVRRLRRLYAQLKQSEMRATARVEVLSTQTAASFAVVAVRHEFRRLVRIDLHAEQATVLSSYPTVGQALLEFLQYCGCGEAPWVVVPVGEAIDGFTKWAQVRHTRAGAQEALNLLYRSQSLFTTWSSAIQRLEARLDAVRAQRRAQREFSLTRLHAGGKLRLAQLEAARTLDPLVQAIALHRVAQAVYFHALDLLANAMGKELPTSNQTNANTTDSPSAGTPASFERAVADALEGLNTHLRAVIAT
jgi:hypothetical protein